MAAIRPIRTEEDYEAALARISELMDALPPPEGQIENGDDPGRLELDVLSDLVERYEDKHYPIGSNVPRQFEGGWNRPPETPDKVRPEDPFPTP